MEPSEPAIKLWDFGWLQRDHVSFSRAKSDAELIESYLADPGFRTTFLGGDTDQSRLHGPFVAANILPGDFVLVEREELAGLLDEVNVSEMPGQDEAARALVLDRLLPAFENGRRCYVLRYNETSEEQFHDWGYVFSVFREFLFLGDERNGVERFVLGYD